MTGILPTSHASVSYYLRGSKEWSAPFRSLKFVSKEKIGQYLTWHPISTCEAERSFSTLRRLKTYLRSTITQQRLNDLTTHRDETKALDLNEVVTEFVSRSQIHQNKFGVQVQ